MYQIAIITPKGTTTWPEEFYDIITAYNTLDRWMKTTMFNPNLIGIRIYKLPTLDKD